MLGGNVRMKKTILAGLSALSGAVGATIIASRKTAEKERRALALADKHLALYLMMNQWVKIKQQGKNVSDFLEKRGYYRIAIYGMGYVGETLVEELRETSINVLYGIDKNADGIYSTLEIYSMDDELETVDAIVVTPISFFDEIASELYEKINCPILSIDDILYEV